jgi:hypothetical protein
VKQTEIGAATRRCMNEGCYELAEDMFCTKCCQLQKEAFQSKQSMLVFFLKEENSSLLRASFAMVRLLNLTVQRDVETLLFI